MKTILKIVLLLDNKDRELAYLRVLKETLENTLSAQVHIIGSVANEQKILLYLHQLSPQIVFMSQSTEDTMQNLARYIKKSGGLVYIVPSEITIIPALSSLIVNKTVMYSDLLNTIFLPGEKMKKLYQRAHISSTDLVVTGSPKIDVLALSKGNDFLTRKMFLSRFKIPNRKNVVIFPSFITIDEEYLYINSSFSGKEKEILLNNTYVLESQKLFIQAVEKLCQDFPNYNIILKPHPLEKIGNYQNINSSNFYLILNANFYNCINAIDLCIHWSSTVATECWIKKIPTIQYVPIKKDDNISEFQFGNPVLHSYNELYAAVNQYTTKLINKKYLKFQEKYVSENYYKVDGKASLRISQYIKKHASTITFNQHYSSVFKPFVYVLVVLEKIIGTKATHFFASLVLKNYHWRYAAYNTVWE